MGEPGSRWDRAFFSRSWPPRFTFFTLRSAFYGFTCFFRHSSINGITPTRAFAASTRDVHVTRANGSVVASFGTWGKPEDCTYENNHLWVAVHSKVFCYDVSNAPAVLPASVGRIKALFK